MKNDQFVSLVNQIFLQVCLTIIMFVLSRIHSGVDNSIISVSIFVTKVV